MNAKIEKYPIGVQTFEKIRTDDFVYVDKTALVYKLSNENHYVFLSRPRRFGKSLLLSTLQAYFEGRRELFKGLAIDSLEKKWTCHPVIYLSLSGYNPEQMDLDGILDNRFRELEEKYGCPAVSPILGERFRRIIRAAYDKTGRQVVILIDEYDAPMVAHIGEDDKHEKVRNILKSVYVNLKEMDQYIRFGMLTGVSRFSKVTIFSGLNNLKDITLDETYTEICGITEQELKDNFAVGISRLAEKMGTDYDRALMALKDNYDGYHFTSNLTDIYNPFSLINALDDSKLGSYWFVSGTPTFLIKQIWRNPGILSETFNDMATERTLSDIDSYKFNPVPLMFQTGYLTIKDYDPAERAYTLGIPNKEVKDGLFNGLLTENMGFYSAGLDVKLIKIRSLLFKGEIDEALGRIKSILGSIPYSVTQGKPEIYFENNLYLLFMLLGIRSHAEWQTSRGRIDMLLETPDYVYVMELKLDGTPEQALAQIDSRDYTIPFRHDGRQIVKVGLNFSSEARNIDSWLIAR